MSTVQFDRSAIRVPSQKKKKKEKRKRILEEMATRIGRRKSSVESPRRRGNPASKSKTGAREEGGRRSTRDGGSKDWHTGWVIVFALEREKRIKAVG